MSEQERIASAYPLSERLRLLTEATRHLLDDHNCDHQGYEIWQHALVADAPIETTAEDVGVPWFPLPRPLLALALILLFLGGARASGFKLGDLSWPDREHAQIGGEVPVVKTPKAATESWLLSYWLPTVAHAPYGAWDRCTAATTVGTWNCLVVQNRAEDELPVAQQLRWRVRVTSDGTAFRVLRVRRIQ